MAVLVEVGMAVVVVVGMVVVVVVGMAVAVVVEVAVAMVEVVDVAVVFESAITCAQLTQFVKSMSKSLHMFIIIKQIVPGSISLSNRDICVFCNTSGTT